MMKKVSQDKIKAFQKEIWRHYKKEGRKLPWRSARNPYRIVVSEIMLQQTQVSRVLPKYKEFLKAFPNWEALGRAKTSEVLRVWQGLGYNRRALALKKIAEKVAEEYKGKLPRESEILKTFPGIGEATASSICTFAFNKSEVFIETNVRSVFIHFFFPKKKTVHDKEIIPLVERALDSENPREWYFALMDYGVMLKKKEENPSRRSAHHMKQKPFKDSDRYIRGQIIKLLTQKKSLSERKILKSIDREEGRIKKCLNDLKKEGFFTEKKRNYFLVS